MIFDDLFIDLSLRIIHTGEPFDFHEFDIENPASISSSSLCGWYIVAPLRYRYLFSEFRGAAPRQKEDEEERSLRGEEEDSLTDADLSAESISRRY